MPSVGSITENLDDPVRAVLGLDILCALSDARARDARRRLHHGAHLPPGWRQGRRWVLGYHFQWLAGLVLTGIPIVWASDLFWRFVDQPCVDFARWLDQKCTDKQD